MSPIIARIRFVLRLVVFSVAALIYAAGIRLRSFLETRQTEGAGPVAFVFISTHPFDGLWQRPQQLAVRLAKSYPLLYFWPRYASDLARRRPQSQPVPSDAAPLVHVLCPILLPFERALTAIYRMNLRTSTAAIKTHLTQMAVARAPILWLYAPRFTPLLDSLDHAAVVYDIMDEHAAFAFARRETGDLETRLLREADVVFAGTNALAERKRKLAPHVKYLPCGVEFEHFSSAAEKDLPIPAPLSNAQGPVIGYFGAVDDRLDFDMILAAAKAHPDWTILLAGPWLATTATSEVKSHPNILLPGLVPYAELPAYLARFDVAVMPFVLNELTMHIHPTKVLEYLASKTPVVSTPIPDVANFYSGIVTITATPAEFVAAVEASIEKPDADAIERGFAIAKASSWDALVEAMKKELENALAESKDRYPHGAKKDAHA